MTKEDVYRYAKKTYELAKENFDFKKGAFFGSLAGLAVGLLNCREGIEYAVSSGAKEMGKCMAVGSLNMGLCRNLATSIENKTKAYLWATVVPTALSIVLTYGVHAYIKGTPHPVRSTAPTALNVPFFLALAVRERKKAEREGRLNFGEQNES